MSAVLWADLEAAGPLLAMIAAPLAMMLLPPRREKGAPDDRYPALALAGCLAAAALLLMGWDRPPGPAFDGSLYIHRFGSAVALLVVGATALTALPSARSAVRAGIDHGEYYMLLLFAAAGMMALPMANDFLTFFLSLEVLSLAVYALVGVRRGDAAGGEGALKYFVNGAFASAVLLFGAALVYGATASVGFGPAAGAPFRPLLLLPGALMILTGLAFKIGAVPFHGWVPDAYEGAPAAVTGFMAAGVKAAAFGALFKLALGALWLENEAHRDMLRDAVRLAALASMIVGNVAAIAQPGLKRMLAYSGIAHTGYLLIGVSVALGRPAPDAGGGEAAAILLYLAAYGVTILGAFGVAAALTRQGGREADRIESLSGLARRRPVLAAALGLFLLSLAGVPPAGGFLAKLLLFRAAIDGGDLVLAIAGILASIVSVAYYLRPIVAMYFQEPADAWDPDGGRDAASTTALAAAAAGTLLLGILPALPLIMADEAVRSLLTAR